MMILKYRTRANPRQTIRDTNPDDNGPSMSIANHSRSSEMTESVAQAVARRSDDDPVTHHDALSRNDSERWKTVMKQEYDAQISNNTCTLTEL